MLGTAAAAAALLGRRVDEERYAGDIVVLGSLR